MHHSRSNLERVCRKIICSTENSSLHVLVAWLLFGTEVKTNQIVWQAVTTSMVCVCFEIRSVWYDPLKILGDSLEEIKSCVHGNSDPLKISKHNFHWHSTCVLVTDSDQCFTFVSFAFLCRHTFTREVCMILLFSTNRHVRNVTRSLVALLSLHPLKTCSAKQTWNAELTGQRKCYS